MEAYVAKLRDEERIGTANSYNAALSSIKRYLEYTKNTKLLFEDLDVEWLNNYERYLLSTGISNSTIGIYMRSFRTIVNIGIENGFFNRESYPFGKRKYIIPASRNIKKALKKQDISAIFLYIPISTQEEKAKDLWMFSYLCSGINVKDICHLQYKNIDKDSISFIRAKTVNTKKKDNKPIRIILNPQIKEIIQKWALPSLNPEDYVFGFINENDTAYKKDAKVKFIITFINKYMKRIGVNLGIAQPITSYTARHSFATILKNSGVPTEYISESLGHASLQTTAIYLASFEDDTKVKYQNALLDFVEEKQSIG
jgi:integrase